MGILVTGGAGFIGSALLHRISELDEELVCIDNFDDFYSPQRKRCNIERLVSSDRVNLYEGDVRDTDLCRRLMQSHGVHTVYHLAARPGPRPSLDLPMLYQDVNCGGTLSLLEASAKAGIKKFVFGSSSSVYGGTSRVPFREDDPVADPFSPYAATKRAGELFCHAYHHTHGFPVICLRFFSVYGPRLRPDLAIYKFTELLSSAKPLPIFGDGSSGRDYTYISDILDGLLACLDLQVGYEIINLGNSRVVGLLELIRLLADALGVEPKLDHRPPNPADPPITWADLAKAHRLLGYSPKVSIEEGLKRLVQWYKTEVAS